MCSFIEKETNPNALFFPPLFAFHKGTLILSNDLQFDLEDRRSLLPPPDGKFEHWYLVSLCDDDDRNYCIANVDCRC